MCPRPCFCLPTSSSNEVAASRLWVIRVDLTADLSFPVGWSSNPDQDLQIDDDVTNRL
jgi:hypothetical protein